ncbi:MAG: hypothetical protein IT372_25830 [Polyangiaceae bacterium]|nr:hypothetical protein [Polyangiaceae bacterium]
MALGDRWPIDLREAIWLVRRSAWGGAEALPPGAEALAPAAAAARVSSWFPRGWGADDRTLAEICLSLEETFPGSGAPEDSGWLHWTVRRALEDGRLVAVRMPFDRPIEGFAKDEEEEPPAPRPAAREEKTWIEIRLVDDDGLPVAGERYRVDLADGSAPRYGRLDAQGYAYVAGIPAGSCTVSFPDLDERDWQWKSTKAQPMSRGRGA